MLRHKISHVPKDKISSSATSKDKVRSSTASRKSAKKKLESKLKEALNEVGEKDFSENLIAVDESGQV